MSTLQPMRQLSITWLVGLMLGVLAVVGLARWQGWHETPDLAPTVWEMSLRFEDLPNGDVRVTNASNGHELAVYSGEQGFLRGTLRAMARQRRLAQATLQEPLVLRGLQDGRLQLVDPLHGQTIDLDSFGPSNKAVFAALKPDLALSHK